MVFTSLLESAAHALEFFYTWPAIVLFLLEVWRHNPITATRSSQELDSNAPSLDLDSSMLYSSLRKTVSDEDFNGWSQPGGKGFMVRSQTYNEDSLKVCITSLYPLFIFSSSPEKFFVLLKSTPWAYLLDIYPYVLFYLNMRLEDMSTYNLKFASSKFRWKACGWWSGIWWGTSFETAGSGLAEIRSKDRPYCIAIYVLCAGELKSEIPLHVNAKLNSMVW